MNRNFRIAALSAALALPALSGAFAQSYSFNNAEAWPQEKIVLESARSAPSALPLIAKPLGRQRLAAQGQVAPAPASVAGQNGSLDNTYRQIYSPGGRAVYP